MSEKIPVKFNNEPEKWEKEIKLVEKPVFAGAERIMEPETPKEGDAEREAKIKKLKHELADQKSAIGKESDMTAGAEEVKSPLWEGIDGIKSPEIATDQEKKTKSGGKFFRRLVALASLIGLGFAGSQNEASAQDVKTVDKNTNSIPTFAGAVQEKGTNVNKAFIYNQGKWVTDAKTGKRVLQPIQETAGKNSYGYEQKDWSKVGTPEQIAERAKLAEAAKERLKAGSDGSKWGNVK
ncbi:MAG: hypothetical protein WCT19_01960 [Candidatus Paceibacterota bacterium]